MPCVPVSRVRSSRVPPCLMHHVEAGFASVFRVASCGVEQAAKIRVVIKNMEDRAGVCRMMQSEPLDWLPGKR